MSPIGTPGTAGVRPGPDEPEPVDPRLQPPGGPSPGGLPNEPPPGPGYVAPDYPEATQAFLDALEAAGLYIDNNGRIRSNNAGSWTPRQLALAQQGWMRFGLMNGMYDPRIIAYHDGLMVNLFTGYWNYPTGSGNGSSGYFSFDEIASIRGQYGFSFSNLDEHTVNWAENAIGSHYASYGDQTWYEARYDGVSGGAPPIPGGGGGNGGGGNGGGVPGQPPPDTMAPDDQMYYDFISSLGGYFGNWVPQDEAGQQDYFEAGRLVATEQATARPGGDGDRGDGDKGDQDDPQEAGNWETNLFESLGLPDINHEFADIIDRAIREDWTMAQFQAAIYGSRAFDMMFPNIKRPDGSLRMSPTEYRTLQEAYEEIGYDFGIGVNTFRTGLLIEGGVSPEEFARRAQAIQNVRGNKELMGAFNDQLRLAGLSPLDEQGFFRFVAGSASPEYYDVYEGALLSTSGLSITMEQARASAKKIGQPGEPIDVAALVRDVKALLPDAGPELMQLGVTDADLIELAAGIDPKNLGPQLQTIVANRRSQGSFVAGSPLRSGTGGGLATLPEDLPANY